MADAVKSGSKKSSSTDASALLDGVTLGVAGAGSTDDDELRAVDGRVPGRRGLATRARLLEQTLDLLRTTSYRDLKVVDIARGAGTSPATFYQYFPDAESALGALADELVGEGRERLTRSVRDGSWSGRAAYDTCEHIAATFLDFWDEHRALLAVIDLAATEGDVRFREIRLQLLMSFTDALSAEVGHQRDAGRLPSDLDPTATASVLVAMLVQVSGHRYGIERHGATGTELQRALARLVYSGVTGRKPPS
ncbi:MAG TPA: TetR family transcriptional regulator [Microthrixaceae bacterium]|nr:TetR family transcriptional regulator [Microthrixaceae bacterium]